MSHPSTATAETRTVSESVVEVVAEAEETDPLELTPPLYEVIEPDALDQVFAATPTDERRKGTVTFSYNGYEVTVRGDGDVSVDERDE